MYCSRHCLLSTQNLSPPLPFFDYFLIYFLFSYFVWDKNDHSLGQYIMFGLILVSWSLLSWCLLHLRVAKWDQNYCTRTDFCKSFFFLEIRSSGGQHLFFSALKTDRYLDLQQIHFDYNLVFMRNKLTL